MTPPTTQQQGDISMADTSTTSNASSTIPSKSQKPLELTSTTVRSPPYSYMHIQLFSISPFTTDIGQVVDALQFKSFLSTALKQFLGLHGSAIPFDILKTSCSSSSSSSSTSASSSVSPVPECWIRLPRDDLAAFAAAITAWQGTSVQNEHVTLRIKGAADWLGTLVGRDGEDKVWSG